MWRGSGLLSGLRQALRRDSQGYVSTASRLGCKNSLVGANFIILTLILTELDALIFEFDQAFRNSK